MNSAPTHLKTLFKALSDDLRLRILQVLGRDSYGVLELSQAFGVSQPNMSHHLKVLSGAGLLDTRREGNSIFYRRQAPDDAMPGCAIVRSLYCELDRENPSPEVAVSLQQIWRERAERSRQFFIENAAHFEQQQDLICAHEVYAKEALALLAPARRQRVVEIGPGAGELLPALAASFESVLGLDNSAEMLDRARLLCNAAKVANVELLRGDTRSLASYPRFFDGAVINMVLHHVAAPAELLADVAQSLAPKGILVVTELCAHEQVWAREACGDVWLGFAPSELSKLATDVGLTPGQSSYLALRNGFQVQLQQFIQP